MALIKQPAHRKVIFCEQAVLLSFTEKEAQIKNMILKRWGEFCVILTVSKRTYKKQRSMQYFNGIEKKLVKISEIERLSKVILL